MTSDDPVRASAGSRPEDPALDDGVRRLTYRELDRRIDDVARRIAALKRIPGGRLAFVLPAISLAVELVHAGPRAGLVVAPLSPRLTTPELSQALEALDPVAVVCRRESVEAVAAAAGGRRVLVGGEGGLAQAGRRRARGTGEPGAEPAGSAPDRLADLEAADVPPEPLGPEAVRYVLWTSGTSGRPRGVLLTGRNVAASARASRRRLGLGGEDRWLASLSPAHVGGLALVTRAAYVGSALVVRGRLETAELARLAESGEVSHASLVPIMLRRLLEHRGTRPAPDGVRCLLIGGAPTPEPLVRRALDRGYPLALTYGMTETTSQVTTAPPGRVRAKPDAVGPPLDGVQVRIADDGEIRVRGATLAAGYLDSAPLDLDGEGWLRTDDLGRLDEDGDLRVTGRRSDRIVSGGVTVDVHEVESVLRSVDGVVEVTVVGLPDPEWGERVAALVVLEGSEEAGRRRLEEEARARLSGPKRPRLLRFADVVPRTRTGKVDRTRVRELLAGG